MRWLIAVFLLATSAPGPALADTVTAARLIRAQTVLSAADLAVDPANTPGAVARVSDAVGQETQVTLYPGRPVMLQDLGAPALIERNAIVTLVYRGPLLDIRTEARALGRAAIGERVRVMNLSSRTTVFGTAAADGTVIVAR